MSRPHCRRITTTRLTGCLWRKRRKKVFPFYRMIANCRHTESLSFPFDNRIVKFASRCVNVCSALPVRKIDSSSFADQLFRSSTSVAANYAEASEAESRKDFIHKLKVAMKELSESRVWLKIIGESGYIPTSKLGALIREAEELSNIIAASIITARGKRTNPTFP